MPLVDNKYAVRRATMTREENAIIRKLIEERRQTLSNHIVSCVDCGDAEYGRSGKTGIEYAKELVAEYNKLSPLFQTFPPDDMWEW